MKHGRELEITHEKNFPESVSYWFKNKHHSPEGGIAKDSPWKFTPIVYRDEEDSNSDHGKEFFDTLDEENKKRDLSPMAPAP